MLVEDKQSDVCNWIKATKILQHPRDWIWGRYNNGCVHLCYLQDKTFLQTFMLF